MTQIEKKGKPKTMNPKSKSNRPKIQVSIFGVELKQNHFPSLSLSLGEAKLRKDAGDYETVRAAIFEANGFNLFYQVYLPSPRSLYLLDPQFLISELIFCSCCFLTFIVCHYPISCFGHIKFYNRNRIKIDVGNCICDH